MDLDTLLTGVPERLASRLSEPRFRTRLSKRHAKRHASGTLLAPVLDDREEFLLTGGTPSIQALVARAGAHVLWPRVLRIVHRADLIALTEAVGGSPRRAAENGRDREAEVLPLQQPQSVALSEAILAEGALCWACWIATRDTSTARRLRALTPKTIMDLIPHAAPGDAEEREVRRFVVDVELNEMVDEEGGDDD